jgi:hypothetical protein
LLGVPWTWRFSECKVKVREKGPSEFFLGRIVVQQQQHIEQQQNFEQQQQQQHIEQQQQQHIEHQQQQLHIVQQ